MSEPVCAIFVFANRDQARAAGFVGPELRHPKDPVAVCWWPKLEPERLMSFELSHVFVYNGAFNFSTRREIDETVGMLRRRLRIEPMLWMDL